MTTTDVFFLGAGKPISGGNPAALKEIDLNSCALDWQLHSLESIDLKKIYFLGGYQIEKIIERIKTARGNGASFCVITGGEPLQHNLDNFCKAIKKMTMGEEQNPMKIHIETSGVNSISGSYDWITLSPKRHSPPKNYFLKNCNEIKIIINEIEDIEFAIQIKKETLKQYQLSKSGDGLKKENKIFYLQPAWNNANGFSLAIDFVKNNPDWKLSLQTHKYLKIN